MTNFKKVWDTAQGGPVTIGTAASCHCPYTENQGDEIMLRIYCIKEPRQTMPQHKLVLFLTDENVFDLDTLCRVPVQ